MIESCYWKEELLRIARSIRKVSNPARLSVRAAHIVERDIMVGFFLLRRLIEWNKVSSATRDQDLDVWSCRAHGKSVTLSNNHRFWELYDFDRQVPSKMKPVYISNQFIHAYTGFISRDETRNWSDVFVVSDFDRNDCIWRVPVSEIERIFRIAANDYPYHVTQVFNKVKGDYDVKTY